MLKRPSYIVVCLVVLLTLIVLNLPSHTKARLKLGIGSLFLPLLGLAGSSQQLAGATLDRVVPRGEKTRVSASKSWRRTPSSVRMDGCANCWAGRPSNRARSNWPA